jgi:hypothetical protein
MADGLIIINMALFQWLGSLNKSWSNEELSKFFIQVTTQGTYQHKHFQLVSVHNLEDIGRQIFPGYWYRFHTDRLEDFHTH